MANAMAIAPGTARSDPSSPSSPRKIVSATAAAGTVSAAASTAMAMARSRMEPRLCSKAGDSPTVIRPVGQVKPQLATAARTRSRASLIEVSGSPTMVMLGRPLLRCACTSTS